MKSIFIATILLITISCTSKKEVTKISLKASIDSSEKVLYSSAATAPINYKNAEIAVQNYLAYAEKFPEDSVSANYLFKAAEVASAIKKSKEAIAYFEKFISLYPNNVKAPAAMFLQAFIYENNLSNLGQANTIYSNLIKSYPNTRFAKDAESCIKNLGKSPEDLIREFEAKNKSTNQ